MDPDPRVEVYGMSVEEVKLIALQLIGIIWDQDHIWGDVHSTEMNKDSDNSALVYICKKIMTPDSPGRIGAFQTLILVSASGNLIPEFCARGIIPSILKCLHSRDSILRLYASEIIRNFSRFPKLTEYVDALDLLRNMIDAFYNTDNNKIINLLLDAFLNLSDLSFIRVDFANSFRTLFYPQNSQIRFVGWCLKNYPVS